MEMPIKECLLTNSCNKEEAESHWVLNNNFIQTDEAKIFKYHFLLGQNVPSRYIC